MKLITKTIENQFAKQGSTDGKPAEDVKVLCKWFDPYGAATWYLTEQVDADTFFGFVTLGDPTCAELGYVSRSEVESLTKWGRQRIERDIHWNPVPLAEVVEKIKGGGHM
jgi:hypothetical protein